MQDTHKRANLRKERKMAREQIDCTAESVAPVNRDTQILIDVTPCETEATLTRVCANISGFTDDSEETMEEYDYCSGKETAVEDFKDKVSVEGHVHLTDPAHSYIRRIKYKKNQRRGFAQKIEADGTITQGPCTYTEIKTFGGDMSGRMDFSFGINWDNSSKFDVITPDDGFELPPLPAGTWDVSTPAEATLTYTFPNVTDDDKKALPIAQVFAQKYKIMGADATDNIEPIIYVLDVVTNETTTDYVLKFDFTNYVDVAGINYGLYTNSGAIYPESTEQYTI